MTGSDGTEPPRHATAAEIDELLGISHPSSATHRALVELMELRDGWVPPDTWGVVPADTEEEWLRARHAYLTASDVPNYMGVGKYAQPRDVTRRKATREQVPSTAVMMRGQYLEGAIVRMAAAESGRRFVRVRTPTGASVLVAHPTIPGLAASLDGVELDANGEPVAAVEVKATRGWAKSYYGWQSTRVQLQVQMACSGLTRGHIVVAAGTDMRMVLDIPRDERFMSDLPELTARFWDDVHAYRREHGIGDDDSHVMDACGG